CGAPASLPHRCTCACGRREWGRGLLARPNIEARANSRHKLSRLPLWCAWASCSWAGLLLFGGHKSEPVHDAAYVVIAELDANLLIDGLCKKALGPTMSGGVQHDTRADSEKPRGGIHLLRGHPWRPSRRPARLQPIFAVGNYRVLPSVYGHAADPVTLG